jgi:hypothetical protein
MNKIVFKDIYNDIVELADINMQKKIWRNIDNDTGYISSFTEIYCRLFDEFSVESVIENVMSKMDVNPVFLFNMRKLVQMLNDYQEPENYIITQNDIHILEDLSWHIIIEQAKIVLNLWNNDVVMTEVIK